MITPVYNQLHFLRIRIFSHVVTSVVVKHDNQTITPIVLYRMTICLVVLNESVVEGHSCPIYNRQRKDSHNYIQPPYWSCILWIYVRHVSYSVKKCNLILCFILYRYIKFVVWKVSYCIVSLCAIKADISTVHCFWLTLCRGCVRLRHVS